MQLCDILAVIKRGEGRQSRTVRPTVPTLHIRGLQLGRVLQQRFEDIGTGSGAIGLGPAPTSIKICQSAAVIEMRVGEKHRVNFLGIKGKFFVVQ